VCVDVYLEIVRNGHTSSDQIRSDRGIDTDEMYISISISMLSPSYLYVQHIVYKPFSALYEHEVDICTPRSCPFHSTVTNKRYSK